MTAPEGLCTACSATQTCRDHTYWTYVEPGPDDIPVVVTKSEQEILDEYWEYWQKQMLKVALTRPVEISKENCIEDWVTVNWATRVI